MLGRMYLGVALVYVTKFLYAIIIFLSAENKPNYETELSVMSKYYFVIDVLTVYLLQAAMITLPKNW